MQSLKTTCVGQVFALAKPHDSVGKRRRNRIPKEERKTLVESFIKKHQSLNKGSFPSLSLTHKEVGGSFYTIREIVREIIQENRVLGTSDFILDGHLQDQTMLSSVQIDPVPPLSLPPHGFHSVPRQSHSPSSEVGTAKSAENEENINGSLAASEGSDVLKDREVNGFQLYGEDVGPVGSADISRAQFAGSCSEENDTKHDAGLHDRVQKVSKPLDKELKVDKEGRGFEETPLIESNDTKPVNSGKRVNDDESAMTEMVNMRKNTLGTTDLPAEAVVEKFPVRSVTSSVDSSDVQPSEVARVCEGGNGTEAKMESDSSTETSVDLGEISSSISDVPEEQETGVIVGQMPNQISGAMEKKVEEKTVNVECADSTKETMVAKDVIGNIHETKEFSNGSLTAERTMPTSGTESGDIARSEVTSMEKTTVGKSKLDASDSSSTQKGNVATLNRIKPESWKGQSNMAGHETNPLLAALKSFLTAFVKFWSE